MKFLYKINKHPKLAIMAIFIMVIAYAVIVYARSTGMTGKTSTTSGGCSCHNLNLNTATTLSVASSTSSFTVETGSTTTFTVTVNNSGRPAAGINIAVKTDQTGSTDVGQLSPEAGSGLQLSNGELTHSSPKAMSNGSVAFSFTWTAPTTPGTYYLRAIANAVNSNNQADNDDQWNWMANQALVVVAPPGIVVSVPTGGENWCPGSTHNITWTSTSVTNVRIDLSTDGGSSFPITLASSVSASANSWSWSIPANQTLGSQYRIKISDVSNANISGSSQGNFSIPGGVTISTHPQSQNACTGKPVTFSVGASGNGIHYQWRKNTVNINSATQQNYTISSVQTSDAGSYDCIVTGDCGSPATSNAASLTVDISPAITLQPASKDICSGGNVEFSVTAVGTDINYKWQKNGVDIQNATSSTYSLNNVTIADAGNYTVVVNGKCNFPLTSQPAVLNVITPPEITKHPQTISTCIGKKAFIFVNVSGQNLTFKWRKNGTEIPGSNNDTLFFSSVSKTDEGSYDVSVSNGCSPDASSNSALLVLASKPQIVQQPNDQTVSEGSDIDFTVVANGLNLTYQWRKDGVNLSGKTTADFHLKGVKSTDAGNYSCIVTGDCESDTTKSAKLTVNPAGSGPVLGLMHVSLDFGFVVSGSVKDTTFQGLLKNTGDADLIISSIKLSGTNPTDFELPDLQVPFTIKKAESRSLAIRFNPKSLGTKEAKIEFTSNSSQSPVMSLLGFSADTKLGLSLTKIDFTSLNKAPDEKSIKVENQGNFNMNISLSISGKDASDFSIVGDNTFHLNENQSYDVILKYLPVTNSLSIAELIITIDATGETTKVPLNGQMVTGIYEVALVDNLNVFPNPSNSNIEMQFSVAKESTMDIRIVDLNGNVVKTFENLVLSQGNTGLIWNGKDNSGNLVLVGSYRIMFIGNNKIQTFPVIINK